MDAWRFDYIRLGSKVTRTPQGFLRIPAAFSRTGIQVYEHATGVKTREYRPESEVFAKDSLESFALAPVTDDHPPTLITPQNIKQLAIGRLAEGAHRDNNKVTGYVIVEDADAIAKVERGELREISLGYKCQIDATPGECEEGRYDAVQRSIVVNHAALGPKGWARAGREIGLRMDSNTASAVVRFDRIEKRGSRWVVLSESGKVLGEHKTRKEAVAQLGAVEASKARRKKRKDFAMKQVIINGVTFEVEDSLAEAMGAEQARCDAAEAKNKEYERLQARCDAAEAKNKEYEKDLAEARNGERFDRAVQERAKIITQARAVLGPNVKIPTKKRDLMEAVIKSDNQDLDLSDRSNDYVEARYDLFCENWQKRQDAGENKQQTRNAVSDAQKSGGRNSEDRVDAARAKMIENNRQLASQPLTISNFSKE